MIDDDLAYRYRALAAWLRRLDAPDDLEPLDPVEPATAPPWYAVTIDCPNCYGRPRGECPNCGTRGAD